MPDRTDPEFLLGTIKRLHDQAMAAPSDAAIVTISQLIACLPPKPGLMEPASFAGRSLLAQNEEDIDALERDLGSLNE